MNEQVILSFVATTDIKRTLEVWAREADRSVSAELRQILMREAQRRQQQPTSSFTPDTDIVATPQDLPPSTRQGATQRKTQ
ncbi:MAG: hypothetical protein FOGNACKC_01942 [Anaerolineae bacterium]|nr:hypothetical protein [Anaerolineae bacterium]